MTPRAGQDRPVRGCPPLYRGLWIVCSFCGVPSRNCTRSAKLILAAGKAGARRMEVPMGCEGERNAGARATRKAGKAGQGARNVRPPSYS
jgi:hypothetical protein